MKTILTIIILSLLLTGCNECNYRKVDKIETERYGIGGRKINYIIYYSDGQIENSDWVPACIKMATSTKYLEE